MAKVKAPLFSFSANGQLGEVLVYFPWKGLDCVRTYVIPANPNTAGQQSQRTKLTAAVNDWHTIGIDADDLTAWNRYATTLAAIMSGFNAFVRDHINIEISGETPDMGFDGAITDAGGGTFDCTIEEGGSWDAADILWGYSPTSLINTQALGEAVNIWSVAGVAATAGARIFGRFRGKTAGNVVGYSGIFSVTLA